MTVDMSPDRGPASLPTPGNELRRLPLRHNSVGHLVLTGEIEGKSVNLLLDTGASNTILDVEWCRSQRIALVDTGRRGGGAGGVQLPIYALGAEQLSIGGAALRSHSVLAVDMSHINYGLTFNGADPAEGVLGSDVLAAHDAVIDYRTQSLFLRGPSAR
ncbi:MAG: aspartyl protease family protein [Gemmatimonadaceae bacterium]